MSARKQHHVTHQGIYAQTIRRRNGIFGRQSKQELDCFICPSEGSTQPMGALKCDINNSHHTLYGYMGGLFSADEYVQAMRLRSRTRVEVGKLFERVDLILSPTTNAPPRRVEEFDPFVLTESTRSASAEAFNLAACPALSVP